jgi:hypothetical protein
VSGDTEAFALEAELALYSAGGISFAFIGESSRPPKINHVTHVCSAHADVKTQSRQAQLAALQVLQTGVVRTWAMGSCKSAAIHQMSTPK